MRHRILFATFFALIAAATAQVYPNASGIRVHEEVMRALRERRVDPAYPQETVKAGMHGLVELQIRLNKTGDLKNVQLVSGDPALASSAIEAVKQWHYKPYLLNGEPIEVTTKVTLSYEISSGEGVVRDAPIHTASSK
jgi:TonB family protein